MNPKHKSKLHKGFEKQVTRQNLKPEYVSIVIVPHILSYSSKHGEYRPLKRKFWNDRWNGMNLKNLCNSFYPVPPNSFGSFRRVKDGRYSLSIRGYQALQRKKARKLSLINNTK